MIHLQLNFDEIQSEYSIQTLVFLAVVELKKTKLLFEKIALAYSS